MKYEVLKDARLKRKMTQEQACVKLKMSQTYLSQIESGKKEPSPPMFRKICKLYKIPPVLIFWLGSEGKDIKPDKVELWEAVRKPMNDLIGEYFNIGKK